MARPKLDTAASGELRAYLLAQQIDFRQMVTGKVKDKDGSWFAYLWRETSKSVDRLAEGRSYSFSRYLLPDDHPMRPQHPGELFDSLELGEDDVLRLYEPPPGTQRF